MPIRTIELDHSAREEEITILIGRNIILKLTEDEQVKRLINDPAVKKFLETENLCHKDFTEKMFKLIDLSTTLFEPWTSSYLPVRIRHGLFLMESSIEEIGRGVRPKISETEIKGLKRVNKHFIKRLKTNDKFMLNIESELKKFNPNLEILKPTVIPLCNRCNSPLFSKPKPSEEKERRTSLEEVYRRFIHMHERRQPIIGEFKESLLCSFCGSSVTRDNAIRIPIHEIIPSVREVWNRNIWLEEFVSSVLRQMDWQTWTHLHMLGTSGIPHEIDILGIKKGFVLIGECKTGKVKREDVFTFSTKATDLKSHVALFFSLLPLPEPETREFIEKNPTMILIENACELKKEEIVKKLDESVLKKP
jgi:hypothetical protein